MRGFFDKDAKFKLIFVGSEHKFSSIKFHELCDNMGPTLSVVKSEHDQVFGLYTEIAWTSEGGNEEAVANSFLFKLTDAKSIV